MFPIKTPTFFLSVALALLSATAMAAEPQHQEGGGHEGGGHEAGGRGAGGHEQPHGEPHPGPSGYQRVAEPHGWDARPRTFDRGTYQHNFQAARVYHIGPYHPPAGWVARRWSYGQILPRAYWAPPFLIADYWLFALEVPPVGYEWVRSGSDALLVSTDNGEILQVEYGVFG